MGLSWQSRIIAASQVLLGRSGLVLSYPSARSTIVWGAHGVELYTLRFEDDWLGVEKTIQFRGATPADAFEILESEGDGRKVSLWLEDRLLAHLCRSSGSWHLSV